MACEFNLNFLKELEREAVLKVLYRDEMVRKTEEERIRDVKVKAGEWFFEERAKKYPGEGRHETVGAKLLKSYQKLSEISVIPPTPPPFTESTAGMNVMVNVRICKTHISMHLPGVIHTNVILTSLLKVKSTPSLQQLIIGTQNDSEILTKSHWKEEEDITTSPTSDTVFCDGRKHGSLFSLNSTCTESGNFDKANVTGGIEFALRYIFKACILEIHIKRCKNLAYGEEKKKKYVKVYLLPDKSPRGKRKTAVKKSTVDPEFDETLKYKIEYSQLRSRQLQISVWHAGALKYRVFLGEVVIPLAAWNFEEDSMQLFDWYQLKPKLEKPEDDFTQYSGELLLSARLSVPAQYKSFQFEGIKCFIIHRDQAEVKQKSPVLKKEACPQWKHLFVFDGVTPAQLRQSCLHLTVWDKSTSSSSDQFLGGAKLGPKELFGSTDLVSQSELQWQEVFSNPNMWMDFTLVLHSNKDKFKS
ncbi:hypothetical protein WISP_113138 [Willisornis vidua]|uniref:SYTL3 protein n=1 Tax=Willisornis vidua TaxID=1566151 RepID=A0ABQ9CUW9_9PASS|nr:hypothetical protein WISP_113138 [Willisornis vidua]